MGDIVIGGFALERLVGRGGMADVWLGHHRLSGQAAAIKVITRDRAGDAWFADGFRREVRAVAGLDHPGVVPVFDAGTVEPSVAHASEGLLVAGSPWLAMLYAEQGDLRRLGRPLSWPLAREVLLQVLDALAHAHARDVVHRDLKPGNVLVQVDGDALRLMLTDFGIAHLSADVGVDGAESTSSGTPDYMAPEQLRGAWRDFGPWTDLYALGCMAFEMVSGAPPYSGTSPLEIATRHLDGPVPRIEPLSPVPAGLAEWVRRLMARSPWDRFATAADAAHALAQLPAPPPDARRRAHWSALRRLRARPVEPDQATHVELDHPAATVDAAHAHTLAVVLDTAAVFDPSRARASAPPVRAASRPPMPETWYAPARDRPLLPGVGLGLFGVRAQPFAGRDAERNALWDALRRVEARGQAELVLLSGPEGVGKTALAEWFACRAREVGAATLMRFRFSAGDVAGEATAAGFAHWLRAQGLAEPELSARVRAELTRRAPAHARLIKNAIAPAIARTITGGPDDAPLAPSERFGASSQSLVIGATPRPLIALLDDLQWGQEAIDFLHWQLDRGLPAPLLIVATVRSDRCGIELERRRQLERLGAHTRASCLDIGRLDEVVHAGVIGEQLGLAPRLSDAVREACDGHPLLATQIITDWVESDVLVPTREGYDLRRGVALDIPGGLEALALKRVDRIIRGFGSPGDALRALELAALLGHAVDRDEWRAACAASGIELPGALEGALYDCGLAIEGRGGWLFSHGFIRSALVTMAHAAGRDAVGHRACAESISAGQAAAERRSWHLIRGEAFGEALAALLEAARHRMDASEYRATLALLGRREALMDRLGLPSDDLRRAEGMRIHIEALRFTQQFEAALAKLEVFERIPIAPDQRQLLAERAHARSKAFSARDAQRSGFDAYQDAAALYRAAGDPRGESRTLHGVGWNRITAGQYRQAYEIMERSFEVARKAGLRIEMGWGLKGMASALFYSQQPGSGPLFERAAALFEECRLPAGLAMVRCEQAELARAAGDLETARRYGEAAVEMLDAIDSFFKIQARAALIQLDLEEGHNARAFALMRPLLDTPTELEGLTNFKFGVGVLGAWAALRVDQLAHVDKGLAFAESNARVGFVHPGLHAASIQLGEELAAAGLVDQARRAWRLAADYTQSFDPERAARFRARAAG